MPWTRQESIDRTGRASKSDAEGVEHRGPLPFGSASNPWPPVAPVRLESQLRFLRLFLNAVTPVVALACLLVFPATKSHSQQAPPPPEARAVVSLDPAHGGDDAGGKLSEGQPEKSLNLALASRLRSLLNSRGFQVVLTRDSDLNLDSVRRAEIANRADPQACIVLHATATGSGVHLFVSSLAPVARRRFSPWRTAQAGWLTRSLALAGRLNSSLTHAGYKVTVGRAPLADLDSLSCPAVAVELAPLPARQADQAPTTVDVDSQARIASAIAEALLAWRGEANQP